MAAPKKPPSQQPAVQRPENEIVRVSCRAPGRKRNGCGGQQARVLIKQKLGMGGTSIQYICTKCNRPFHITF
jgi:hypothetical protein